MTEPRQVVIVGGGIIGVSIATHLQQSGASATLITEAELGSGASGRSLSWLNSAGGRSPEYHALRMAGIDRYRTLYVADPDCGWLGFAGGLRWLAGDRRAELAAQHDEELRHGYDSELVSGAEASMRVPGVRDGAVPDRAIVNPGEGWVSLPHLIGHLVDQFRAAGGSIVTDAGRCRVELQNGRAVAVITGAGRRYEGDAVVVACGASTAAVVAEIGVTIPDASPMSMLVTTEPSAAELRTVINSPRVAIRPDPDGGYALDHSWYEDDISEIDGEPTIDESIVHDLVAEANEVVDNGALKAARWKLGRKPVPGDGCPVLGQLPTVPGCFVAFTHSGATLGLIVGELLAYEITTGRRHPMLETFRPERFAG